MRVLILLFFAIAVISVVSAKKKKMPKAWTQIRFPAKVLIPDLEAIANYYSKGDRKCPAYIDWPNSVTFRMRYLDTGYIEIDGVFENWKMSWAIVDRHEHLYFKDSDFFVKTKSGSLRHFSSSTTLYYKQPNIALKTKPYVSIRWFSLPEMQQKAESTYIANKHHYKKVLDDYPAIFMTTLLGTDGQFLEYTYKSKDKRPWGDTLQVRVLRGYKKNKLRIWAMEDASQLLYDQKKHRLTVPGGYTLGHKPLKHVPAVRMKNTAILAEVRTDYTRLYSDEDLKFEPEFKARPDISIDDLLEKAIQVEPKLRYFGKDYTPKQYPTGIAFQVKGITFFKNANIENGKLSESCPFIITDERGKRLCTNHYDAKELEEVEEKEQA